MKRILCALLIAMAAVIPGPVQAQTTTFTTFVNTSPTLTAPCGATDYLAVTQGGVTKKMACGPAPIQAKDFGAVCDNATVTTTGLQAAINAAQTAGGRAVLLPPGRCITGALSITASGVHLIGEGTTATTLVAVAGTYNMITFGGSGQQDGGVSDLSFDMANLTSGDAIHIVAYNRVTLDNISSFNTKTFLYHESSNVMLASNINVFSVAGAYCFKLVGPGSARTDAVDFTNIKCGGATGSTYTGLLVDGFVHTVNLHSFANSAPVGAGLVYQNTVSGSADPSFFFGTDFQVEQASGDGIHLTNAQTFYCSICYSSSNTGDGLYVASGSSDVHISNSQMTLNHKRGAYLNAGSGGTGTTGVSISNSNLSANSNGATGTYPNIYIDNDAVSIQVANSKLSGGTVPYGVDIAASAQGVVLTGNDYRAATVRAIRDASNSASILGGTGIAGGAYGVSLVDGGTSGTLSASMLNNGSSTSTVSQFVASTGTVNSYVAFAARDGATPLALITSGPATTGGMLFAPATGPISLGNGTDSGVVVGSPTGGAQGTGKINATNLYVNGVAVLTTASGSLTINGTVCTLASSCTVTAAAGTLTGSTLASGVTASSLTSVGTLTSGAIGSGFTAIPNSALANSSTTVNGTTCTLGSTCTITATAGSVTVGTTTVTSGTNGYLLYNNAGTLGNLATSSLSIATTQLTGTLQAGQFPALTGDVTTSAGSLATTLATVNSNVGSFGSSTAIPTVTVNGKGLVTAVSTNAVVAPAGTLTGTTLASNVVTSSLTSVGTLGSLAVSGAATVGGSNVVTNSTIGIFLASNYGAVCNNSTDTTTAIQNAINAAQTAGGGTVLLPVGRCIVSSALSITNNGVHIKGQGQTATTLVPQSGSYNVISFGGSGKQDGGVSDLSFDMASITSGYAIAVAAYDRVTIQNISSFSTYNFLYHQSSNVATVEGVNVFNVRGSYCFNLQGPGSARTDQVDFTNVRCGGAVGSTYTGLLVDGFVHTVNVHSMSFSAPVGYGVVYQNTVSGSVDPSYFFGHDVQVEQASQSGFVLTNAQSFYCSNCYSSSNTLDGLYVASGSSDVNFVNPMFHLNHRRGAYLNPGSGGTGTTGVTITGGNIAANSNGSSGTYPNVYIDSSTVLAHLSNVDVSGGTVSYGVDIHASAQGVALNNLNYRANITRAVRDASNNASILGGIGTGGGAYGASLVDGGTSGTLSLSQLNNGTSSSTVSQYVVSTGTPNSYAAMAARDGATPTALFTSGPATTGGISIVPATGGILLNAATTMIGSAEVQPGGGQFRVSRGGNTFDVFADGSLGNIYLGPTSASTFLIRNNGGTAMSINTSQQVTFPQAITYGGVTLSNSVTGTGSMVLSASPTLTGTLSVTGTTTIAGAAATLAIQRRDTLATAYNLYSAGGELNFYNANIGTNVFVLSLTGVATFDQRPVMPGFDFSSNNAYAVGSSGTRASNVYSVLGNFSGTVTAPTITNVADLTLSSSTGSVVVQGQTGNIVQGKIGSTEGFRLAPDLSFLVGNTTNAGAGVVSSLGLVVTGTGAQIIAAGRQGTVNPAFQVDASAASSVTGLNLHASAAGGGLNLSVTSSATDEGLTIDGKGAGTISLNSGGAGSITVNIAADTAQTTRTVCQNTSNNELRYGTGTLGICLGTSSRRFKTGIEDLQPGLDAVMGLRPRSFYLDAAHGDPTKLAYGFIAEEANAVLPTLVGRDKDGVITTFDYLGVVPVLTKAVQEQQGQISATAARFDAMVARQVETSDKIESLEKRLSQIEFLLGRAANDNATQKTGTR